MMEQVEVQINENGDYAPVGVFSETINNTSASVWAPGRSNYILPVESRGACAHGLPYIKGVDKVGNIDFLGFDSFYYQDTYCHV